MAIFHCEIKIITRDIGKSSVAAAAYRAAEKIKNERDGKIHDFTRKGGVLYSHIMLPENAPPEYQNRAILWNAVEKIEKASNSQLARELELAIPREFSELQGRAIVNAYIRKHFVDKGMCADICIHDDKKGNPHAHVMLTMRPFTNNGEWDAKQRKEYILDGRGDKIYDPKKRQYKCRSIPTTDWNEHTKAEEWREAWADTCNKLLERTGSEERLDHRSYERQGVEQIPTIHLGAAVFQMERRGIRTERGDKNREIDKLNKQLRQIKGRISKLQNWVNQQAENAKPPTLADVFSEILNRGEDKTRWEAIADLQLAAQTLTFIQENNIETLEDMAAAVKNLRTKHDNLRAENFPLTRRFTKLTENVEQAEIYMKYAPVYMQFKKLGGEKQDAYWKKHEEEITAFVKAAKYIEHRLDGRTKIPYHEWKQELAEVAAKRSKLVHDTDKLAQELKNAETIKRYADMVMGVPQMRVREHGMGL